MNKEQAKIISEIPDKQLKALGHLKFIQNKRLMKAYSEGDHLLFNHTKLNDPKFNGDRALYYISKKTRIINGIECPMHETIPLKEGDNYFFECVSYESHKGELLWDGSDLDFRLLKRGVIYLKIEDAVKCCKARHGIK